MDRITEIFLSFIRFIFMGEEIPDEYKKLSDDECKLLYAIAKRHDVAHMLDSEKTGIVLTEEVKKAIAKVKKIALYRHIIREDAFAEIAVILEKYKIQYMPLKGSVIKKFYPEEWMRTSTDIDILVHEEDLPEIEKIFTEQLDYDVELKGKHDMGVKAPTGVHAEMHYRLIDTNETVERILDGVWNGATLAKGYDFCYEMPGELFVLYHLAHMAKHFKYGGCGIRYFVDYFLIRQNICYDNELFLKFIQEAKLLKFKENIDKIISSWFGGETGDSTTQKVAEYVLTGGVHGNAEHHVALKQRGKGSKLRYFWRKIFVKGSTLAYFYPKINKYPILTPYYQVKRWMKIFDAEKRKRAKYEMSINLRIKQDEVNAIKKLMQELGI